MVVEARVGVLNDGAGWVYRIDDDGLLALACSEELAATGAGVLTSLYLGRHNRNSTLLNA